MYVVGKVLEAAVPLEGNGYGHESRFPVEVDGHTLMVVYSNIDEHKATPGTYILFGIRNRMQEGTIFSTSIIRNVDPESPRWYRLEHREDGGWDIVARCRRGRPRRIALEGHFNCPIPVSEPLQEHQVG